ncbi:MAG: hypothetical protein ABI605_15330 [Rhizobacter sp.]
MSVSGSRAANRLAPGSLKGLLHVWQRVAAVRQRGPAAFAQALLARHGQGVQRSPRIEMLLALRARKHVTLLQQTSHHLSPHATAVHMHSTSTVAAPVPMGRSDRDFAVPALWLRPATRATTSTASPARTPAPEVLVRAAARNMRIESLPTAPAPTRQALPLASSAHPPVLIASQFSRQDDMPTARPRPAPVSAAAPEPAPASAQAPAPAAAVVRATAPQALPAHEIERIADHVMGSIDRRIVAARERLGRF